MNDGPPDPSVSETGITIPPPFVTLAALLTSFLFYLVWPWGFGLPWFIRWPLVAILMAPLFLIFPSILAAFNRADSEYDVRRMPKALVTGGAFRFSRNPGYVLFTMFFSGIAVAANNVWGVILILATLPFIHFKIVLKEEEVLEKRFGQDYLDYKRRVRRWI